MSEEIKEQEQARIDKLEKEKLEEVTMYKIELGYHKWATTDKDQAFKLWQGLAENFFELEELNSSYGEPKFAYRKDVEVRLVALKVLVWKDQESAQKAYNAFKALKESAVKKSK